jgi:HD-like signal output (HDOD) protein
MPNLDKNEHRERIIELIKETQYIPSNVVKTIEELNKSDVSIQKIVQHIEMEPAITANILKIVNSSAYSLGSEITTISDACTYIGKENIMQILITSSVMEKMQERVYGYDLPPGELWRSSVTTGVFCRIINKELNLKAPEYTFTAGLLRDIGKNILGKYIDEKMYEINNYIAETGASFLEAEQTILGIDHAEVGAILLENWQLPQKLITPIRYHHTPNLAEDEQLVTNIVHVADILSSMIGGNTGTDGLMYHVSNDVARKLNLNSNMIELIAYKGITEANKVMGELLSL